MIFSFQRLILMVLISYPPSLQMALIAPLLDSFSILLQLSLTTDRHPHSALNWVLMTADAVLSASETVRVDGTLEYFCLYTVYS